mgnify:CR=1 FL=1
MSDYFNDKRFSRELQNIADILETYYRDMVDFEFTIENEKLYLLSARRGKRTALACLKIAISMFCEGKIDINECINMVSPQALTELVDHKKLINTDELVFIGSGLPSGNNKADACGVVVFSYEDAEKMIRNNTHYILCKTEMSPEDIDIISSAFCAGIVTSRGGMTSHAAVASRGLGLPCVSGMPNAVEIIGTELTKQKTEYITLDVHSGRVYVGQGYFEEYCIAPQEKDLLFRLLLLGIQYNIWEENAILNAWSLWDIIVNGKRYREMETCKRPVSHTINTYKSFAQPSEAEMESLKNRLFQINNGKELVDGLVNHLIYLFSAQVPLGEHHKYVRPLFDPMKALHLFSVYQNSLPYNRIERAGTQVTGIEFFNVNKYLDCYIDIERIKIIFETTFSVSNGEFYPLNFLDFTNPMGESININNFSADRIAIQINDAWIEPKDILMLYHLFRRRAYHWRWYKDNHVTKQQIIDYLNSEAYLQEQSSSLFHLCQEVNLLDGQALTPIGVSLKGSNYV